MQKIKLDQEIILIGEEFNVSVREDPDTRQLHVSFLTKTAELFESMHLPNKLDMKGDKHFQTFTIRAIGSDPVDYGDGGGEIEVSDPNESQVEDVDEWTSSQEFFDERDRQLNKLNLNV